MKTLIIPLLLLTLCAGAQDFKDYSVAHLYLSGKAQYSRQSSEAHLSGNVLMSCVVIKGELTAIKTLYADSRQLESDAIKTLQITSGRWKFCKDSTVIIIPFAWYYLGTSGYTITSCERPLENIQLKEVINGTILPTVICRVSVSECNVPEPKKKM
jgi:hypothetical protein